MNFNVWRSTLKYLGVSFLILTVGVAIVATAKPVGPPVTNAIWVDDELFGTVATPTNLPDKGPKDGIFSFMDSGLSGQRSVAEAKPGDQDYNGGRWQVYLLKFTEEGKEIHDKNNDGAVDFELTNWEQVKHHIELGHFEVSDGPSFVCPLDKKK